jgi:RNA polymerase sigma-32 factor
MPKPRKPISPSHPDLSSSLMAAYVSDVSRHPLLSREEELVLAREYVVTRAPRLEARLMSANLRLVMKIAWEYHNHRPVVLDLIQEGNLGLLEAIRRFDPERGVRLPSYAGWWIRAYMLKYIMDNARVVRMGRSRTQRAEFFGGRLPPPDVSLHDVIEAAELALDRDMERERPDLLVEELEAQRFVSDRIAAFGTELDQRESFVFTRRILATKPAPLRELGEELDMTGERVRQIEKSLVARFRDFVGVSAAAA